MISVCRSTLSASSLARRGSLAVSFPQTRPGITHRCTYRLQYLSRPLSFFSDRRHKEEQNFIGNGGPETRVLSRASQLTSSVLMPLNKLYLGPLARSTTDADRFEDRPKKPMVFLLGNHSSGKSSFVNYLQGRSVQTSGVAPTDDAFTIITSGDVDSDQDGPALVGNTTSGFAGLRSFGPNLINHVNLKVRAGLDMKDIMLVDTPGMIDSPAGGSNPWDFAASARDRGYDFQGVTKWFADRADVICLFFDPDKPGTTGETLAALTTSLAGHDHKLIIILNKVDQFERMHDFARSYGSLCWNLSKVIPRKDLPRIYTMCIPGHASSSAHSLVDVLDDLDLQREEVVAEVKRAPQRKVDNVITTLYDSARILRTHVVVADAARAAHRNTVWKVRLTSGGILSLGTAAAAALASTGAMAEIGIGVLGCTLAATAFSVWQGRGTIDASRKQLTSKDGLNKLFRDIHIMNIADGDEFLVSLWEQRVSDQLQLALKTIGLENIEPLSSSDLKALDDIVQTEAPKLRSLGDPFK